MEDVPLIIWALAVIAIICVVVTTCSAQQPDSVWFRGEDSCHWITMEEVEAMQDSLQTVLDSLGLDEIPPMPPDSVVIEYFTDGDSVRISWQPVTHDTAGNEICISLYYIYHSPNQIAWTLRAMTLDQYHSVIIQIDPSQIVYSPRWYYHVRATPGG